MENAMNEDMKRKLADEMSRNGAITHGPYPGAPTPPYSVEAVTYCDALGNLANEAQKTIV